MNTNLYVMRSEGEIKQIELINERRKIMDVIINQHPDRPELVDLLDVSRSTVYRILDNLIDAGLIKEEGRSYYPTPIGTIIFDYLSDLLDIVEKANEAKPLLDKLDMEEIDPIVLKKADITISTRHSPDKPYQMIDELLHDASKVNILTPVISPRISQSLRKLGPDGEISLILEKTNRRGKMMVFTVT